MDKNKPLSQKTLHELGCELTLLAYKAGETQSMNEYEQLNYLCDVIKEELKRRDDLWRQMANMRQDKE